MHLLHLLIGLLNMTPLLCCCLLAAPVPTVKVDVVGTWEYRLDYLDRAYSLHLYKNGSYSEADTKTFTLRTGVWQRKGNMIYLMSVHHNTEELRLHGKSTKDQLFVTWNSWGGGHYKFVMRRQ